MTCTHFYAAMATPGWRKCIHCMSTMPPAAESIMLGGDASPAEPTTAEAFAEIREMLKFAYDDDEPAVIYLTLLERRMARMWTLQEIEEQARVVTVPSHPDVAETVKRTLLANLALIRR